MTFFGRENRRQLGGRLLILVLLFYSGVAGIARSTEVTEEPIKAQLIASTDSMTPGVPFTLGVFFKIEPGWHLYWKSAGDAGLPPIIKWNLPAGWTIGSLQWPLPVRFIEKGPLTTYGYADSLLLVVAVTPPADIPLSGKVTLTAKAKWLVCHDECIPGGADLSIKIPITATGPKAEAGANDQQFATWRKKLPALSVPSGITVTTRLGSLDSTGRTRTLTLSARSTDQMLMPADWFPAPTTDFVVKDIQITKNTNGFDVTCEIHSFRKPLSEIGTLESLIIGADSKGGRHGITVVSSLSSKS